MGKLPWGYNAFISLTVSRDRACEHGKTVFSCEKALKCEKPDAVREQKSYSIAGIKDAGVWVITGEAREKS